MRHPFTLGNLIAACIAVLFIAFIAGCSTPREREQAGAAALESAGPLIQFLGGIAW